MTITVTDTTDTDSTDLVIAWRLLNLGGTVLASGTASNTAPGVYQFTITKTNAETMTKGQEYILDLDDNATGFGMTFDVTAEYHKG